ncbi:MAG: glycosyltransferase family 4 protein [Anaerolineales bacterium]|nr:glycosyltransferase family 4 protein [Anaerolineales bacterium]
MWNLPRSLPALAEILMPGRVAYYIGDYWPTLPSQFENYWDAPARNFFTGIPKSLLKPFAQKILADEESPSLDFEHMLFPSAYLRDELMRKGVSPKNAEIIYGAIDTSLYLNSRTQIQQNKNTSLLYIGRLTHEKGVHTAIDAVEVLVNNAGVRDLELLIVGDGDPEYVAELHASVRRNNLASFVTFMSAQPKEALSALYHQSDIFLFTSIWAEPFGRVIVEAMASGVVVVGTSVGGAAEILSEDVNALIFTPDDPSSLSKQLKRLVESPELRNRLAKAGRETAIRKFDIERMTNEIEAYLKSIVQ